MGMISNPFGVGVGGSLTPAPGGGWFVQLSPVTADVPDGLNPGVTASSEGWTLDEAILVCNSLFEMIQRYNRLIAQSN